MQRARPMSRFVDALKRDHQQGHSLLTLEGGGSMLKETRVSPDGNVIGAGGFKKLNLWRAPSWEEIRATEAKEGRWNFDNRPRHRDDANGSLFRPVENNRSTDFSIF